MTHFPFVLTLGIPFMSFAQCLAQQIGFASGVFPSIIDSITIHMTIQSGLLRPTSFAHDDPIQLSSITRAAIADFRTSDNNTNCLLTIALANSTTEILANDHPEGEDFVAPPLLSIQPNYPSRRVDGMQIKNNGCTTLTETANITVEEEMVFGINWASEEVNGFDVMISASRQWQSGETYNWYIDFNDTQGYKHMNGAQFQNKDLPGLFNFSSYGPGEYKIKLEIITDGSDPCTWTSEKIICVAATPKDCCNCAP